MVVFTIDAAWAGRRKKMGRRDRDSRVFMVLEPVGWIRRS
jgi:hypothetical protein